MGNMTHADFIVIATPAMAFYAISFNDSSEIGLLCGVPFFGHCPLSVTKYHVKEERWTRLQRLTGCCLLTSMRGLYYMCDSIILTS